MNRHTITRIFILAISALTPAIAAAQSQVIWTEGEDAFSVPAGLSEKTQDKLPASGGKSLKGKSFGKKGNKILFKLTLPQNIPDARMSIRYTRLHVMRWTAAEVTLTVKNPLHPSQNIVLQEKIDQTGGWGTRSGQEWGLHTIKLGNLAAGPIEIEFTVQKDNSDLNLDGFFLSSGPLSLTEEDFKACLSNQISSDGFIGLQIANTAINQNEFNNIRIVAKGFNNHRAKLTADLLDEAGNVSIALFKEREITLAEKSQFIEISPADLKGLTDGSYTLKVHWDNGEKSVSVPLVAMGDLLSLASAKADEYEAFANSLDQYGPAIAKRLKGDIVYAVEYIRNTLILLKSRDGNFTANDSAHKIALSYFEKAVQRSAAHFSADLRGIIKQTDETIRRVKNSEDPYANRSGDLRRAFYSDFSGMLEPYRVLVPKSYWKTPDYKFLLALHGAGGDENYYPENDNGSFARSITELGYLVAAPKANLRYRNGGEKDLEQLVRLMQAEYPAINADQLFCTGVSMGGGGTYRMALAYPNLFRAVAIVSSGLRGEADPETFDNFKSTPVLILHGEQDGVSPVANAYRLENELKKRNFTYEIEVYPKYGHAYHGAEYMERTHQFFRKFPAR